MVHSKTTDEWHTDDIQAHTCDMWMANEWQRMIFVWHRSTHEWYSNDV